MPNPYDELPYYASAIEWSAPERLALASLLHGGPRVDPNDYRMLELGCANGANLLPLAWYRRHATFIGLDGAGGQIVEATRRASALGLRNVSFVHSDFATADTKLEGEFDFIIAHGVLSWIDATTRDALLELCARRLKPGGLLYFNYNAKPGWTVRGMVRDFLRAQTGSIEGLRAQVDAAQAVCRRLVAGMEDDAEHPYRKLMANEFKLVRDAEPSYVGHEYLAPNNQAYWRSELLQLVARHGLAHVAEADFNYPWASEDPGFIAWLDAEAIVGTGLRDTADLLRYRQLRSSIFSPAPLERRELAASEVESLYLASCLSPRTAGSDASVAIFDHPTGYEVTVDDQSMHAALLRLQALWPRGLRVGDILPDVAEALDDLRVLHRNGLVELRLVEPEAFGVSGEELQRLQAQWRQPGTTALHSSV